MFECELHGDLPGAHPTSPDERQIGVEWLPLATLPGSSLYPKELRNLLANDIEALSKIYIGDVN
jgi:8-oxo-dGTP diphosphatase